MKTMKQELMSLLLKRWLTPLDALNLVGCMSLSQRCGEFRREQQEHFLNYGFLHAPPVITSKWVKLPNGKRVKAYRAIK